MLKADLHIHTKGDPVDTQIQYTTQDLINLAAKQKFDVLGITWHNKLFETNQLRSYARKKGITLLQGVELTVNNQHTLVYNITKEEAAKVKTLDDLYQFKDHVLVGAPHPFFVLPSCLGNNVFNHPKLFDFIEHSHFYTKRINFNKKAIFAAQQLQIPLVGNSDVHHLSMFGKDFTHIDAAPTTDAILDVLKKKAVGRNKKKVEVETQPYKIGEFLRHTAYFTPKGLSYFITKRFEKGLDELEQ